MEPATPLDLDDLPDDLEALGELFKAASERAVEIADAQPPARTFVDGQVVIHDVTDEDRAELDAARAVCQAIALKMHRVRQAGK